MCMTFFRGQIRSGWNQFKYKYRDTQPFIPLYPDLKKEFVVSKKTLKQQTITIFSKGKSIFTRTQFIPGQIWGIHTTQLEWNPEPPSSIV